MSKPTDFLLNTDYEMDKIVYFKSGEFTNSTEFEYNLSFTPLIFGVWSTSSDFSSSNAINASVPEIGIGDTPPLGMYSKVENGKIYLSATGQGSSTTKIYYRVYAFEPLDSKNSAPHTSSAAKQFIINTDYNYRKLKASGTFTQSGQEYEHNLGYIPHVVAWSKDIDVLGGAIEQLDYASTFNGLYITVTPTKIKVTFPKIIDKVYWRIYYDET